MAGGEMKTSTFRHVNIGEFRYLFLLCSWHRYEDAIWTGLRQHASSFGEDIGEEGLLAVPYDSAAKNTIEEVLAKEGWSPALSDKMAKSDDPFLLVIDTSFAEFDPRAHRWAVLWFSDVEPKDIPRLLGRFAGALRREEDLFALIEKRRRQRRLKSLAQFFEVKPGLFGCSVNLTAAALAVLESD
jgi:hypothetical protein